MRCHARQKEEEEEVLHGVLTRLRRNKRLS